MTSGILKLGAGHIPGTSLPQDSGNIGIAAHRDTWFRPLRVIRANNLDHLKKTLEKTDTRQIDIVALSVRLNPVSLGEYALERSSHWPRRRESR